MSNTTVRPRPALGLLTISLLAFAAGCPGEENPVESETPSISVSISPSSASVEQGSSTDVDVSVVGSGGFTGAATITLQNAPSGVSGSVGDVQSTGGNTTATLTISVGAGTTPGNYNLTVRATGSGVAAASATFALTVTAAPAYEMSATPAQLVIEQGAESTTTIGVARTNFTEAVTLAVEGAPAGMTTAFDVNPVVGDAAVLTVSPDGTVDPGMYTLTVRGTGGGLADRTVTVDVTVTEPAVPDYVLSVDPSTLTINQGASEDATVTITRSNFSGAVTLAAEGVPADVSVSFSDNPVSGTTSEMTVVVAASVATGPYSFTLRGTATGLTDKTATVDLTVEDASEYSVTLSPSSISIDQGASGTVDVSLARTNFTEAVTLSLEDAPAGVTGTFSVNPVAGAASVLTLDVAASTTAGTYDLTVRGTSASLSDETASLTLVVTEPPGFALESIAPLSLEQGASDSRVVTITRTGGFGDNVTVTVTGLPAGITATVDPVTTAGDFVTVTVDVAVSVAVGNYQVTVRGNAPGQPEATQTLDISVTPTSGQQVSLDFSVCQTFQRPAWVAYQDGSGPWTPVTGVADVYTFNVTSSTAAVAAVIAPPMEASSVLIYYATQSEVVGVDVGDLCDVERMGKTVNASVAGIGGGEGASITLGDETVDLAVNGAFSFDRVPNGNLDLVGYKWTFTGSERMIIVRDLNPADGADIGTLDFAGSGAFDPVFADITLTGGTGMGGLWFTEYATFPGGGACYYAPLDDFSFSETTFTVGGAPPAQQEAGDFHVVTATDGIYTVSEMFATLANRTIAYGPALPSPTVTDITGGAAYRRVRAEVTLPGAYDAEATISLVDDAGSAMIAAITTAAWRGGQGLSVEIPDFTGLGGWVDSWAPTSGSATSWALLGYGWSGDDCTEGAREVSTVTTGSVN